MTLCYIISLYNISFNLNNKQINKSLIEVFFFYYSEKKLNQTFNFQTESEAKGLNSTFIVSV